jgi:Fe-S cluster assembly iron-binding protein IscA
MHGPTLDDIREPSAAMRVLRRVEQLVGRPPRPRNWPGFAVCHVKRPEWLSSDDLINRLLLMQDQVIRDGVLRWACVVQANATLYRPGMGDSGAQVVYAPVGDVPLAELRTIADSMFAIKGTTPADPDEHRLADMLANEYERALDWPVPKTLTGGHDLITSIALLGRRHMPGGVLAGSYFPVLADPKSRLVSFVPSHYWPKEFRDYWQREADAHAQHFVAIVRNQMQEESDGELSAQRPMVDLTPVVAARLKTSVGGVWPDDLWLHIGCKSERGAMFSHHMNLTRRQPDPSKCVEYLCQGIRVFVEHVHVTLLAGTTIDYRNVSGFEGFVFDNPNVAPQDA